MQFAFLLHENDAAACNGQATPVPPSSMCSNPSKSAGMTHRDLEKTTIIRILVRPQGASLAAPIHFLQHSDLITNRPHLHRTVSTTCLVSCQRTVFLGITVRGVFFTDQFPVARTVILSHYIGVQAGDAVARVLAMDDANVPALMLHALQGLTQTGQVTKLLVGRGHMLMLQWRAGGWGPHGFSHFMFCDCNPHAHTSVGYVKAMGNNSYQNSP